MRVYLRPTGLHSRAMIRVSDALARYMPSSFSLAGSPSPNYCDFQILHVISPDAIEYATNLKRQGIKYAVIQYCLGSTGVNQSAWHEMWENAEIVWSYYDLYADYFNVGGFPFVEDRPNFYHAPLGIDDVFIYRNPMQTIVKNMGHMVNRVITSGYVSGPGAEAIEEVWIAANRAGIEAIHIGPSTIQGMTNYPANWNSINNLTDNELADIYASSTWVSGLRHIEGFELPALEGLALGCRPILFDQPSQLHWYSTHGVYVKDRSGEELINDLVYLFQEGPQFYSVSHEERGEVISKFNWKFIAEGFWRKLA